MAKPILVIRVDHEFSDSFNDVSKATRKHLKDEYHVIVVGQTDLVDPVFEVFNVDKEQPITYAKLKKLINKEIEG